MRKYDNLQTYYTIYAAIRESPRYKLSTITTALHLSGRGKNTTTAMEYVRKMYERGISLYPNLILRSHENCFPKAYFLKVKNPNNLSKAFLNLIATRDVSYILLLGGIYDFFVSSRYEIEWNDEISVKKESEMYTPLHIHPQGWNSDCRTAFKLIAHSSPEKGRIEREMLDFLPWNQFHFDLFDTMKHNMQLPFSKVGEKLQVSSNTVKKHFFEEILPYCRVAHYFFPKGYDWYNKSLILLRSEFERGLTGLFSMLLCTTYVFPLKNELLVFFFHDGVEYLLFALKKLEEKGFIRRHLLLTPLHWDYPTLDSQNQDQVRHSTL